MARSRNIKPSFFANEYLGELEPLTRLLFIGLWCYADRSGRLEDRPKRLKVDILPYDECDVDKMLDSLSDSVEKFIVRYKINNKQYIQISNFGKHQNPHMKETSSIIPALSSDVQTPDKHGANIVQELEKHHTSHADSLNPITDSLNPITDSLKLIPSKDKSIDKSHIFKIPLIEEIKEYCTERNNNVDAERFFDFYSSKGWYVGKNKMKDWKSAVRTWESKDNNQNKEENRKVARLC